jgi:uncharacterized membrane protein
MTQVKSLLIHFKVSVKYSLFIVAGLIIFTWLIETPAGILGKADAIGYAVCHRIDFRSFHLGIRQFPLCARCTGQYMGAFIGLLFQGLFTRRRSGFLPKRVLVLLSLLFLAYAVDGLNSYLYLPPFLKVFPGMLHLYEPSNVLRLFTGTGMGMIIVLVLYPAFVGSVFINPDTQPAIVGIKSLLNVVGLGILVDFLILTGSKYILYPAALISAGVVILLLTMAYTIIGLRLFHKENQFTKISQCLLPLTFGFTITIAQIAIFDVIRFIITGTWSGLVFG